MRASKCRVSFIALACALMLVAAVPASADTVSWVNWTSGTTSITTGSATGTISGLGITVSYTGEQRAISTGVFWTPTSSFSGGNISNAPVEPTNQAIILDGGGTVTDTITFSSAVTDPVMAIWSLGAPSVAANFTFTASEPFTVEGGGPSSQFAGTSIFTGGTCPATAAVFFGIIRGLF